MKEFFKGKTGITLIALVITIIVLLILAGVTIAMLTGDNGILTKTTEAKQKTTEAAAKEKIQSEVVGSYGTDGNVSIDELNKNLQNINGIKYNGNAISDSNKIANLPAIVELDGYKSIIDPNGNIREEITLQTAKQNEMLNNAENSYINLTDGLVAIPAGFKVTEDSGITIDEGIVIEDSKQNQFVWVPVSQENFESEFVRREGYYNADIDTKLSRCGEADATGINVQIEETDTTKQEAKDMYKSVKMNSGFYIGRYEAGKDANGKVVLQKNVNVYNNISWSSTGDMKESETATTGGAVELSRNFAKENNYKTVQSTLIYSVQWDAVMNWMKEIENPDATVSDKRYIVDSAEMGWYSNNYSEGNPEHKIGTDLNMKKNQIKKIYDLAGNIFEWTMESYNGINRVTRGGGYNWTSLNVPVSSRGYNSTINADYYTGFRISLFLKS